MTAFSNWNFTSLHCRFTEMFILIPNLNHYQLFECGPTKPNFIAHFVDQNSLKQDTYRYT